jgi:hypothetical protein
MQQTTENDSMDDPGNLPIRFAQLKRDIAASYGPYFEINAIKSWGEIIGELAKRTKEIATQGSDVCILPLYHTDSTKFIEWMSIYHK